MKKINKKELIEKIKGLPSHNSGHRDWIDKEIVLDLVRQLDEPQKVKIPQFVADWYEKHKDDFEFNVWDWIAFRDELEKLENKEFTSWINDCEGNPIQILVNMHQFGYEVEKEPKYTVKFKATNQYLCDDDGIGLHISPSFRSNFRKSDLEKLSLTEVFDSPLFEVEEV